ncbi:nucleotidyltransferase domain-containing protein [Spirosoma foliorum]|uniref:Nucleotidyltransferase n=1 Tax=Spirosoma foliorum TaxID=2710596 RepID=A0A7G5H2T1_9BACT|nr:nucleotidyltransferase [Spirosoma foliorum]QMW05423.1 nucleotidyltransferase [Spirosoma foliorum]
MIPATPFATPSGSEFQISDLDDLLNRLGESLQLDPTRRRLAEERYKTVADWVERDEMFFKTALLNVYPQGSFRIRTTAKPYKRNEFDLDFVVHLDFLTGKNYDPMKVLDQLERRLRENETYKGMVERKNRCIRITYANDFHMDIMVGCQETYYEPNRIIVPDCKTKDWTASNPIGYGDWFTAKAKLAPERQELLLKAFDARNMQIRASENLPAELPYELKAPLERAVQILKRGRDVYFYDQEELATASIILTTLAAEAYSGELSVFEAINHIISYIEQKPRNLFGRIEPFSVPNPANPKENFSEKWFEDRKLFDAFLGFIRNLKRIWDSIKASTNLTLRESLLEGAFGETRIKRLLAEQRDYRFKVEKANRLMPFAQAAGLGTLGTTSTVKPTFEPAPVQNQPARRFGGKAFPLHSTQFSAGTNYLQQRWIEQTYPGVFAFTVRNSTLTCKGKIRPTSDCEEYSLTIQYVPGIPPQVFINSHRIKPGNDIHMYNNGALCLHYPPDIKWTHRTSVAAYTIPWIAEWLVCYEFWKLTGKWEGEEVKH